MAKSFGVFLPVASGGWIVSTATPRLDGLWPQNRDAAILAEAVGLDFVMSMGKWRGFGGETDHWGVSLESVTMMAAIAQATSRVQIWATLHTLLHNPAVAAKTIATLDHISGGRAGLNIVAGAYRGEFEQMGSWRPELDHDERYDLAAEWTACVKRLWREPRVDFDGRYFTLKDCVSEPKPLRPPKLICAGMSDKGLHFSAREADACFIGGRDVAETRAASDHARAIAAEHGRGIEVYAMCTVVLADTDPAAEAAANRYREHIDIGAVVGMLHSYGVVDGPDNAMTTRAQGAFMTQTAIGSPATCAERIEAFVTEAALDGVMLIFPDYESGLETFGAEVLPSLRAGIHVTSPVLKTAWVAPARTALLIVDMQMDFASPEGALGRAGADLSGAPGALAAAERLAEAARRAGVSVVFVGLETTPETDSMAWREGSLRRGSDPDQENALCRAGSFGAAFVGPRPRSGERVIAKRRYSGFLGTALEVDLVARGLDTVVVCGMTTECCVGLTALDAFQRGFHTFVPEDACAAYGSDVHAAALNAMEMNGVLVTSVGALAEAWRK